MATRVSPLPLIEETRFGAPVAGQERVLRIMDRESPQVSHKVPRECMLSLLGVDGVPLLAGKRPGLELSLRRLGKTHIRDL